MIDQFVDKSTKELLTYNRLGRNYLTRLENGVDSVKVGCSLILLRVSGMR
jgi:hypothetical protein